MSVRSELKAGAASAEAFQGIVVGAKQLQPPLAEIAAHVHDHNLCVPTLWMEEPEAFQRNPLAGDN